VPPSLTAIQALAYAHYEVGVLHADGAKALARKGRARSSVATAPRDPLVLPCDRKPPRPVAAALGGVTTAADLSASAARKSLSCCAGLPYSLHLRLPLQVRAAPSTMRSLTSSFMRGLDRRHACKAGKLSLKAARDVRPDFNWKVSWGWELRVRGLASAVPPYTLLRVSQVRLHVRTHLTGGSSQICVWVLVGAAARRAWGIRQHLGR